MNTKSNHRAAQQLLPDYTPSLIFILAASALFLLGAATARAFTSSYSDMIFNDYNNAFYVVSSGNGYYKADTGGGRTDFWKQAEEIEMIIDAYERTGNSVYKGMITETINGFISQNGATWTGNSFNDDILWMCIAAERGYQKTGNTYFRDRAKANFDAVYSRAYDSALGGGLWWTTGKTSKNACVNGPGAIAAYLLYQIYGDSSYLTKANNIYNWERGHLFNATTGAVYDHMNADGSLSTGTLSYNSGTFIGAANYLGLTADAGLAADFMKNTMCSGGIFPQYGTGGDAGGFDGIGIRWVTRYMKDRGLQSTYLAWLQSNANAAWDRRRNDHLSWSRWKEQTPAGTLTSFDCSSSVVALQVVPPDNTVSPGVTFYADVSYGGAASMSCVKGNYTLAQLQAKNVSNDWVSSLKIPSGWTVIMYQNDNFSGTSWTFTGDTGWVGAAANDQMSSCKIQ
jgi:predicted alpha-1,6-mannanase (GH76 family)